MNGRLIKQTALIGEAEGSESLKFVHHCASESPGMFCGVQLQMSEHVALGLQQPLCSSPNSRNLVLYNDAQQDDRATISIKTRSSFNVLNNWR